MKKPDFIIESADHALQFMKKTIHEKSIDCDFSEEDAFIYSITDEYANKIQKEADAYQTLGISGSLTNIHPI